MQRLSFEEWLQTPCLEGDVTYSDLEDVHKFCKIKSKLPPCSRTGPWIVGGTIRRLVEGKELTTDIDVMFKNQQQFEDYCSQLRELGAETIEENDRQITFKYKGWEIQPIRAAFSNTLIQTLNKFDFTICQFGFDGTDLIWSDEAATDLKDKKLVFTNTNDFNSTMRRAFKYTSQGFFMDHKSIGRFLDKVATNPQLVKNKKWEAEAKASDRFRNGGPYTSNSYGV